MPTWVPAEDNSRQPAVVSPARAQWNEFGAMQEIRSIRVFRGVDQRNPFDLHEGAATEAVNLDSRNYPALSPRPGYWFWGPALPAPMRFARWWKLNIKMLGLANGVLYERPTTDAEVAWTEVGPGLDPNARYYAATDFVGNYDDVNAIIADGKKLWRYDGSTLTEIVGAPKDAKYGGLHNVTTHRNRLWGSIRNRLYYSSLANGEDWTTGGYGGSGIFELDVDGEPSIKAIAPLGGFLYIMTRHSLWELRGTGPDTWTLYNVSEAIGVEGSHNCVVEVGGYLYWVSYNAIYRFAGDAIPDRTFSLPVKDYIAQFMAADEPVRLRATAATDGRYYVVALPQGRDAQVATIMLAYDTWYDVWHVWDLGVGIEHMTDSPGAGFLAWACSDGRLRVRGRGTHGYLDGDNGSSPTPVQWKWVSRPFGAGPLSAQHWWYRLWLVVDMDPGSSLRVYVSPKAEGDDAWELVQSMSATGEMRSHRMILPIPSLANANWVRVKLEGAGGVRVHELDFQERVIRQGIAGVE